MWTQRRCTVGVEPCKFFQSWLATASNEEIVEKQKKFEKELDNVHKNLLQLSWYMRGGVSIRELHDMPVNHIKHLNGIVEKNFEMSKKAGMPIL
tara:strand:- start:175 stop:456 length:282 start_codon:yes stop_codon:yes gene_type:complete